MGIRKTSSDPAELERWDKQYLWHPFTQMKDYCDESSLIIERGEGSFIFDRSEEHTSELQSR